MVAASGSELLVAVRFGEIFGPWRCTSPRTGFLSVGAGSAVSAMMTADPPFAESRALPGLRAATAVALAGAASTCTFALLVSGVARSVAESFGTGNMPAGAASFGE